MQKVIIILAFISVLAIAGLILENFLTPTDEVKIILTPLFDNNLNENAVYNFKDNETAPKLYAVAGQKDSEQQATTVTSPTPVSSDETVVTAVINEAGQLAVTRVSNQPGATATVTVTGKDADNNDITSDPLVFNVVAQDAAKIELTEVTV